MITVNRTQSPEGILVHLVGTIEESVNLEQLIGPVDALLIVNCRGITRINSVGVKTWMKYFQGLRFQGHQFKFVDCSQPIVEQLNMISNFDCGGKVESILLPFYCSTCKQELIGTANTSDLKESGLEVPNVDCGKQNCAAKFDDDPDEYFSFLDD